MRASLVLKTLVGGALLAATVVVFQNCSEWSVKPSALIAEADKAPARLAVGGGNGEGYGGKPDGDYGVVDVDNACGHETATEHGIRNKISIRDGRALSLVENCVTLAEPRAIALDATAVSRDGNVVISSNLVYQRGPWASADLAPKDQYVDLFCVGESPSPSPWTNARRALEVAIYNDRVAGYDPIVGTGELIFARIGILQFFDLASDGSELNQGQVRYDGVREHAVTEPGSDMTSHLFISPPSSMTFSLMYASQGAETFHMEPMLRYQSSMAQPPATAAGTKCWSSR